MTIDDFSLASAIPEASATPAARAPVFALWRSSSGDEADVLLDWHSDLPKKLPEASEEVICTLQLCVRGAQSEYLEARLQQHHLGRPLSAWSSSQLERLMRVMALQTEGDPPHQDEVRMRRAPGRMVIDVHFRRPSMEASAMELGGCVVEILNAYAPGVLAGLEERMLLLVLKRCTMHSHLWWVKTPFFYNGKLYINALGIFSSFFPLSSKCFVHQCTLKIRIFPSLGFERSSDLEVGISTWRSAPCAQVPASFVSSVSVGTSKKGC